MAIAFLEAERIISWTIGNWSRATLLKTVVNICFPPFLNLAQLLSVLRTFLFSNARLATTFKSKHLSVDRDLRWSKVEEKPRKERPMQLLSAENNLFTLEAA